MGLGAWNMSFQQKVGEAKGFGDFDQNQSLGGFDHFAKPMLSSLGFDSFMDIHQLEPVPIYYEKYSSFFTPSPPEQLLGDIDRNHPLLLLFLIAFRDI